ncbi:hypothetical protein ACFVU3_21335 [Streptomyces sp. NPDC058052]|uniref:hypothetical protein n=1 Tax=Streptomyces sp. NPDC058052 TaxID=3346316 RepID=UPI0036E37889
MSDGASPADPSAPLTAADLVGRRLLKVTTAWYRSADGEPEPLHLWLHLEGLGPVQFHTPSTGVSPLLRAPHGPYEWGEHGSVHVDDDSPDVPLTRFVGQPLRSVREIRHDDGRVDFPAGLRLRFPGGSVRLLGLDDDLLIAHDRHLGAVEAHLHEDGEDHGA